MLEIALSNGNVFWNRKPMWAALALASVVGLVTSCTEQACTDAGCSYPLTVRVEAASWVPGEYVVALTESGRTFECRIVIGADGAGGQAGNAGQDPVSGVGECDQVAGDPAEIWEDPEVYGGKDVTIEVMHAAPKLPLSVRRNGTLLLETELTPSYTKSQPNGPECGPTCLSASETLTLPDERP